MKQTLFLELSENSKSLSRESLLLLWNNKCVRCRRPAVVIHEVIYKSMLPGDWMNWRNQVALCSECHEWAHSVGIDISKKELRGLQILRISQYYLAETTEYLAGKLENWFLEHP